MQEATDYVDEIFADSFAEFLAKHWEKAPLHGQQALKSPQDIFDRQSLQESVVLVANGAQAFPCVLECQTARPLSGKEELRDPLSTVVSAFHRCATILIPGLQNYVPVIAALCRQIDNAFLSHGVPLKQATFANAYFTPSSGQGFGAHFDDHCILVLQLEGAKHWVVAPPSQPLPINRCTEIVSDEAIAHPLLEIELKPGDVLYVPRGFVHSAHCTDKASLHLTLGIRTVTWSDLIPRLAKRVDACRASVMPLAAQKTSTVSFLHQCLVPSLAQADLLDALMDQLGDSLSALPPLASYGIDRFNTPSLSADTVLSRTRDVLVMLESRDNMAMFHFPGGPLTFPAAMVDALVFISETERFAVAEIPEGRACFDKVDLARLLLRRGLISVEGSGTAGAQESGSILQMRMHYAL